MTDLLQAKIEVIEAGYEFLLAYAAQGKETDGGGPSEVRATLERMAEAATIIIDEMVDEVADEMKGAHGEFGGVVADDARKSRAAIALVLAQNGISSEIVDNLNASIHLRAFLTDLFLVSEADARRGAE